jgi:hypothetical protein
MKQRVAALVADGFQDSNWKWIARIGAPITAILIPAAFFFSVGSPTAKEPNALINLAYVGAAFLALAVLTLGVGLMLGIKRVRTKLIDDKE